MDVAALLAPIAVDDPCGVDVSFSPEVDAIQELRRADDPTLDQGAWVAALKTADWPGVARACEALLQHRSKDLRLAGWLADAEARRHGLAGLADGLELCAGLVERYWTELHPRADDAGADAVDEPRSGHLRWLAARVATLAPRIVLVAHGERRFDAVAIAAARQPRLANAASPSGADPAAPTPEALLAAVRDGGPDAAARRRADLDRAAAALQRLDAAATARLADDAPSFGPAHAALAGLRDELDRLDRETGLAPPAAAPDPTAADPTAADAQAAAAPHRLAAPRAPDSRAEAIDQLRRVAAYFRATEPHSPVAYLADKAARWADMPLHEWLRAVVKDGGTLARVEELLGVAEPTAR